MMKAIKIYGIQSTQSFTFTSIYSERYLLIVLYTYERFWEDKTNAFNNFLDDYETHHQSYIYAKLPNLPFPDQAFDLVLSSHFLFLYSSITEGDLHIYHDLFID